MIKLLMAASVTFLACAAPAGADSGNVAAKVGLEHEAELQSGETMLIADHRNKPGAYRICIRELPGDVKLKVFHDGEVTEVLDGTCQTITARHIDVKVDSKLPPGDELQLKFKNVNG